MSCGDPLQSGQSLFLVIEQVALVKFEAQADLLAKVAREIARCPDRKRFAGAGFDVTVGVTAKVFCYVKAAGEVAFCRVSDVDVFRAHAQGYGAVLAQRCPVDW